MAFFTRTNVTPANGSRTSNVPSLNLSRLNIQDAAIRQKLLGPSGIIQQSTQSELIEGPQGPEGPQGEQGQQNYNADTRVIASHPKQQDFYDKVSKLVYQKSYNGLSSPNSIPFIFYFCFI